MKYSTLYENRAREKIGINSYEELRVALSFLRKNENIYVISVPSGYALPEKIILDSVGIGDSIDVLIEGEEHARDLAESCSKATGQPIGITKYVGQTAIKLQSELDVAKKMAEQKGMHSFCYTDWKRTA